jgi:hypothetical protein
MWPNKLKPNVIGKKSIEHSSRSAKQSGMNSLATTPVQVNEAGTIKPPTPDQARLAALKRQKDNVAKQIEAERDRQKIHRAQQQISQVTNPKSPSVA